MIGSQVTTVHGATSTTGSTPAVSPDGRHRRQRIRTTTRTTTPLVLIVATALLITACGDGGTTATPSTTPSTDTPTTVPTTAAVTTATVETTVAATVGTTAAATLPAPVAAWSLRGDGKASVGDLDLEFVGGYTITADGVAFDGFDGQAVTNGTGPLDASESVTLSAWVAYTDQRVPVPMIVSLAGENVLSMGVGLAGEDWLFGFGNSNTDVFGGRAVRSSAWVHLVGVSDREAGVIRIYVNGRLIDETEASEPPSASGPVIIGGELVRGGWAGAIVDVAVYQAALTADQVAELAETTRPDGPPPEWTPDPATYADGILDGTWDQIQDDTNAQQILNEFVRDFGAEQFEGVEEVAVRFGFDGPRYWQGYVFDGELFIEPEGSPAGSGGTITVGTDVLTLHEHEGDGVVKWRLEGETLKLGPWMFPHQADTLVKSSDDPSYEK